MRFLSLYEDQSLIQQYLDRLVLLLTILGERFFQDQYHIEGEEDPEGSTPLRGTPVIELTRPVKLLVMRGTVSDCSVSGSTRCCAGLGGWIAPSSRLAPPDRALGEMTELKTVIFS